MAAIAMVDIYKWHLAHPNENNPNLVTGTLRRARHNRDAMGLSLKLTKNVLNTYVVGKRKCCTICTSPLLIL